MAAPTACRVALLLVLTGATTLTAQESTKPVHPSGASMSAAASKAKARKMTPAEMIRSAVSAAPREIGEHAAVIAPDSAGKMTELRAGTNGWTCMADEPDTPGLDPMCLDKAAMQWAQAWMAKAPKPTNTAPGIIYMLQGGSDISATDPFETKTDHYIASPPHYMIMWPYDAKETGFSTKPKKTGSWIMWAGTPYAHLMVNQTP